MNKVITIFGPTASGKTSVSIKLAKVLIEQQNIQTEIINFDSLLFYRELNIGTAKPSLEERDGVTHHLIDIASAKTPMNASDYVSVAEAKIKDLHEKNILPILVGGSGFYLRALIKGMYKAESPSLEIKNRLETLIQQQGVEGLRQYLSLYDPQSLTHIHQNDLYRNSRAVEYHLITGTPISVARMEMEENDPYDFTKSCKNQWDCLHLYLDLPKEQHYKIIFDRTKKMIELGLIDEVKNLLKNGFSGEEKPLCSIGYKETQEYLRGMIASQEQLVERISISTRQLAKSQRTWFKKIEPKKQLSPFDNFDICKELVLTHLN